MKYHLKNELERVSTNNDQPFKCWSMILYQLISKNEKTCYLPQVFTLFI
jgi:hypothetical protein